MKKLLLITATFLIASIVASAQAIVTENADKQTFSFGNSTSAPAGYTREITVGTWAATSAAYDQYNAPNTTVGAAKWNFELQGSSDIVGKLSFNIRLNTGTSIKLTVTAGSVSQSYVIGGESASPYYLGNVSTTYEIYTFPFATDLTFSNGVKIPVTFDMTETIPGTVYTYNRPRFYSVYIDKTSALSTNDFGSKENLFSVYPNPVNDSFQVNSKVSVKNVVMYTISGQLVKTVTAASSYDISDLKSGMYLATINSESGSETIKIIKE